MGDFIGDLISLPIQEQRINNANRQQEKLMDLQLKNQQILNNQGSALQYEMWQKTNYPAQVKMLKEAGLNPSLLYSKGGPGGVTGSQGGGSAASGSAYTQQFQGMDIMSMLKLPAEIDKMKAEAEKARADAKKTSGVDTTKAETEIEKIKAEIGNLSALTDNEKVKNGLLQLQTAGEAIRVAKSAEQIDAAIQQMKEATESNRLNNEFMKENWNTMVEQQKANLANTLVDTLLKEQQITASKEQIENMKKQLLLADEATDQKDKEILIKRFEAMLKAEFPGGVSDVAGAFLQRGLRQLEDLGNSLGYTREGMKGDPKDPFDNTIYKGRGK